MPLKGGKSREAVSSNIRTEMHEYDRKGKIGTSHPESRKKAQKQAVAIALSKARKSGAKIPEKRAGLTALKGKAKNYLKLLRGKKSDQAANILSKADDKRFDRILPVALKTVEKERQARVIAGGAAVGAGVGTAVAMKRHHEKKASQYLAKIATMVAEEAKSIKNANKIIKDDAKATERKYNPNYKFFTLQKMRGC
jgi:hypothetical protein